jgi:hypothetical protein
VLLAEAAEEQLLCGETFLMNFGGYQIALFLGSSPKG